MLPKDLKKPIDEIQSPAIKILIICFVLSVLFLVAVIIRQQKKMDNECVTKDIRIEYLERANDSLIRVGYYKTERENQVLQSKLVLQDSLKTLLQNELNNEIKRRK